MQLISCSWFPLYMTYLTILCFKKLFENKIYAKNRRCDGSVGEVTGYELEGRGLNLFYATVPITALGSTQPRI